LTNSGRVQLSRIGEKDIFAQGLGTGGGTINEDNKNFLRR